MHKYLNFDRKNDIISDIYFFVIVNYSGGKMIQKVWKYRNETVNADMVENAARNMNVPKLVAQLMLNRGISAPDFKAFLSKSKQGILNPMTMLDMDKATDWIIDAINNGEHLAIYGDYDVDGITSTALL